MPSMNIITRQELDSLCQFGQAIDNKAGYPAVVIHPDNTITKIWARKKKLLSSATLRPYSNRFVRNAGELRKRGVTVPEIINHTAVENSHIRLVTYRPLPGQSIRELLKDSPTSVNIPDLCQYIYQLHESGIFFRGMHLGNIIQQPDNQGYGLIDFTDVTFHSQPLSLTRRAANMATPIRYTEDTDRIKDAGLPDLQESYLDILKPSESDKEKFANELNRYLK